VREWNNRRQWGQWQSIINGRHSESASGLRMILDGELVRRVLDKSHRRYG
jgi:hypothetical protein